MSIGGDALKAGASGAAAGSAFGPWGAVIGAGVSALGSVAGNLIQGNASKKNAEQQQKYNKEILALQNTYNLDMFNRANEWNSPVNERARLEAAGINPLQMNGDAGEAAALQSAGALGYQQPMAVNPFSGVSVMRDIAEIENIRANTAKMNNENVTETQRRENMIQELQNLKAVLDNLNVDTGIKGEQKANLQKVNMWYDKIQQALFDFHESATGLNNAQKNEIDELLQGKKDIQIKTLKDFEARWNLMHSEIRKNKVLAELSQKDVDNYIINHMDSGILGTNISIKNLIIWLDKVLRDTGGRGMTDDLAEPILPNPYNSNN